MCGIAPSGVFYLNLFFHLSSDQSLYSIPSSILDEADGMDDNVNVTAPNSEYSFSEFSWRSGDSFPSDLTHSSVSSKLEEAASTISCEEGGGGGFITERSLSHDTSGMFPALASAGNTDVEKLVESLVEYSVCIGRGPGFKITDIQSAIEHASHFEDLG